MENICTNTNKQKKKIQFVDVFVIVYGFVSRKSNITAECVVIEYNGNNQLSKQINDEKV